MTKYLMLVALVAAFSKTTWAIDRDCDFSQTLAPGTTYYISNPEYPGTYSGARSCRWYARSATNIRLSCQLSLQATTNCAGDRLSVSPSGDLQLADAHNYCGAGFNLTSDGSSMHIVFTALAGTRGGRFSCTLEATTVTAPTCDCGWKNQVDTRIAGGTATGANVYPMMAGLVHKRRGIVTCGGTIISPKHVLSAAHCVNNSDVDQLAILVGDYDTSTGIDTTAASIHPISGWVVHPLYDSTANDIAVISVRDTIVYTIEVGPACLPFQYASATFVGTQVTALGWGSSEIAGGPSKILQQVELDVISVTRCQQTLSEVTTNQLCTHTPEKDTCRGDSGGPLLRQNPNSTRLVLVGVVSYGKLCADMYSPAVNTRVGAYMDWILSVTPGINYCRAE